MSRHPSFDLAYTHQMPTSGRRPPREPVSRKPNGLALTARLLGLKALLDMERERGTGQGDILPRAL